MHNCVLFPTFVQAPRQSSDDIVRTFSDHAQAIYTMINRPCVVQSQNLCHLMKKSGLEPFMLHHQRLSSVASQTKWTLPIWYQDYPQQRNGSSELRYQFKWNNYRIINGVSLEQSFISLFNNDRTYPNDYKTLRFFIFNKPEHLKSND